MGTVIGHVGTAESDRGIPGLLVSAFSVSNNQSQSPRRQRLGSSVTGQDGSFVLQHREGETEGTGRGNRWDLLVTVEAAKIPPDGGENGQTLLVRETRQDAGSAEAFRFLISEASLKQAGVSLPTEPSVKDQIAHDRAARSVQRMFAEEGARRFINSLKDGQARRQLHEAQFREQFLARLSSGAGREAKSGMTTYLAEDTDIQAANLDVIRQTIADRLPSVSVTNAGVVADDQLKALKSRYGPGLERIPADAIEPVLWPWKRGRPGMVISKFPLWKRCPRPPENDCVKLLEGEIPAKADDGNKSTSQNGAGAPAGDGQVVADPPSVATLVHAQTDCATCPETLVAFTARAGQTDVNSGVDGFLLRSGPADSPALFDFHHLQIAFEPVWQELFDSNMVGNAHELYSWLAEAGVDPNLYLGLGIGGLGTGKPNLQLPLNLLTSAVQQSAASPDWPVTSVFEITTDEWNVLTQSEHDQLNDLAACLTGEKPVQLNADGSLTYNLKYGPFNTVYGSFMIGDDTTWTARMDGWAAELNRRCRHEGERIIENARAKLLEPTDFDRFHKLLSDLDASMKEPYRFNVYAASGSACSINFGIVVTYRQRWEPVSYQVGELVKTIPLAPKESRKFTKKTSIRHTRAEKEASNSLESHRTESADTWRAESQIVAKAVTKTDFQLGAKGGVNLGIADVSGSMALSHDAASESEETKKEFREAVFKAADEYKQERSLQIETNDSVESTVEETGEISNPNDEIPVTYLFYQLQRRFRINEEIHVARPVVLVAQQVPKPDEIDEAWMNRYDWVLRRVLLDDSFAPALVYLATKVVGDEVALNELYKNLEQHRQLVDDLKDNLLSIQAQVGSRYAALETAIAKHADDVERESQSDGSWIPMPVGFITAGSDGTSPEADRLREDAAKDAYERAAQEEKELQARLDRATTALEAITGSYTKQLTEHLNRKAQIDRLRVHIKQNIFYYMQAIWSYEPPDERFFRLHDLPVPRLVGTKTYKLVEDPNATPMPPDWKTPVKLTVQSEIEKAKIQFDQLGEIADIDNLLGFKGNFMIFPMREGNDLTDFLMTPYYGQIGELIDPDPLGNWTLHDFVEYVCCLKDQLSQDKFLQRLPGLTKAYQELKDKAIADDEIVVPTDSLYIEALPGVRPVLEDFKLLHRAIDVKKVRAEVRSAELENVRLAARLLAGERGDPTVQKEIVIEKADATVIGPQI